MSGTYSQKYYINIDLNRNELRNAIAGSGSYLNRPTPNSIDDKGLFYYDHFLSHLMVWDGYNWKITQIREENTYSSTDNLLLENLWTQTNAIPVNPGNTSSAIRPNVTQFVTLTLSHLTNSYVFTDYSKQLKDVIPNKYGIIYEPTIKDSLSVTISTTNYKIEGENILFYNGFVSNIGPTQSPSISFIKYIGDRGTFQFPTGDLSNINITGISYPYDIIPFPFTYSATPSNVNTILFINGVAEFDWIYNFTTSNIIILTGSIGYPIDSTDKVYVHYRT